MFFFIVAHNKGVKQTSLEEVLNILMSGFLRGSVGFLKGTGEIIKGSSSVNREVRVGVTHVSITQSYIFKLNIFFRIEVETFDFLPIFTGVRGVRSNVRRHVAGTQCRRINRPCFRPGHESKSCQLSRRSSVLAQMCEFHITRHRRQTARRRRSGRRL